MTKTRSGALHPFPPFVVVDKVDNDDNEEEEPPHVAFGCY
jgi:hypothetical protein